FLSHDTIFVVWSWEECIMDERCCYICGPLTELPPDVRDKVKAVYSCLAGICQKVTGVRGFAPHEHYDPVAAPHFTPQQVDAGEREQVCKKTSCVIVVALAPSWGGGIEVEMANRSGVPVILLAPQGKQVSRLLRGNPAVMAEREFFSDFSNIECVLQCLLEEIFIKGLCQKVITKRTTQ
ncbi:MAG: hypothetical protein A2748_00690, partial [Candidatus Wildermuthbacteria bacterium RIFCSPHIGHO2_01_FULL_45_20]